jgi:lipoyl synthase
MQSTQTNPKPNPKPEWLKIRPPGGENYLRIKSLLKQLKLHTVCEEARCPNIAECWSGGTATVMLLGDTCTRGCRFCHVKSGNPKGIVDLNEPSNVAHAICELGLTYVVLTSVDRDDLPDGGADHFAQTVENIKKRNPEILVEVLIPDFKGERKELERICESGADVIAHNMETVERLTPKVRDVRATYKQSLEVLRQIKEISPKTYTKTSLMVGLGETLDEVIKTMDDLRAVDVQILTFGQYLRPSQWHLPVEAYISPQQFKEYEDIGLSKGFLFVPSGPLVRSSYKAGEKFLEGLLRG